MAKKTSEAPQAVNCSICSESIPLDTYAKHIQEKHSTTVQSPTPPPTTGVPRASIPNTPIPPFPSGAPPFLPPQAGPGTGPMGGGPRPMTGPINAGDYAGVPYLKGSDLPNGVNEVRVKVKQWIFVPGQRTPLACHIEPVYDKEVLGVNKTNIKQLMALGFADLSTLVGRTLVLGTYPVNNPTTGQMAKGLWITSVV